MAEEVLGNLKVRVGMDTTEFVGKSRSFGDQLKILKSNMSELSHSISHLDNKSSLLSKQIENNRKQYELYNQKIKENNQIISNANRRMDDAQKRVSELNKKKQDGITLTSKEQKELNTLVKETHKYTKAEQKAANQTARFKVELAKLNKEFTELTIKQKMQNDGWLKFGKGLQNYGKKLTTVGDLMSKTGKAISTASAIASAGIFGLVKVASDYESAFAGVRKTVNATEPELQKLSNGFRSLSKELPVSANELAKIGENAGQLGIHVPNILGFTEVMAKLGLATNLTSDEASSLLAKFANITQMPQDMFDRLGSSIVALGNNFATTEADIVSMATNLAGAGHAVGLTEADILGVATALSAVGIEAERGGSTFSKLMINMKVASEIGYAKAVELSRVTGLSMRELELLSSNNSRGFKKLADSIGMTVQELDKIVSANKNLERFAEVAGMSAETFKDMFSKDTVGAIAKFVEGLATAEQRGTSTVEILNEMGISEVRLRDTLLRMGGAQNLFNDAVAKSNMAWKENNALNKEVAERNKTTASQFERFKNKVIDVAITAGEKLLPVLNDMIENSGWLIDSIKGLVEGFANMDDGMKKFIIQSTLIGLALGPTLSVLGNGIKFVGGFSTSIGSGIVKLRNFANAASATAQTTQTLSAATTSAGIATKAFTFLTNPWVLGITAGAVAIGGLVTLYNHLTKETRESSERIRRWGSDVGVELDKTLLKAKQFSDEVAVNMDLTNKVNVEKMSESYSGMFKGLMETVDTNTKEFETLYGRLSENAKKYAQDEFEARIKKHEDIKTKIAENEAKINSVLQKASAERRALRKDEKDYIAKLEDEAKQLAIATFKQTNDEQLALAKKLSSDLKDLDENILYERHDKIKEAGQKIIETYRDQAEAAKEALSTGGLNPSQYKEEIEKLDAELLRSKKEFAIRYVEVVEEQFKRMDERIKNASESEREALKIHREQMLENAKKILQEYDVTWEQAVQMRKNKAEQLSQELTMLANGTNAMVDKLSENVKKANEHWNGLITDKETGRVVSNIQKVLSESIKTQEGWQALKFDIKHADLSTNAREEIKKVLDATGKWDELTIEEKNFVTATNSGLIMAKILQDKEKWDSLQPEVKNLLLHTNATEEQAKYITAFELWTNADFVAKWAEISTNAPDAQQKFTELLNRWNSNEFKEKHLLFQSNKDEVNLQIDSVANRINSVPAQKNINFKVSVVGLGAAMSRINNTMYHTAYATGTQKHHGGLAILGDGGRREPFLTPDGQFGISPDIDTLYNLPSGTKVWSSINKFRNSVKYDTQLRGLISQLPRFATGTTDSFLNFNMKTDFLNRRPDKTTNFMKMTGNKDGDVNIYISGITIREELDIKKMADEIGRIIDRNKRNAIRMRGEYYV